MSLKILIGCESSQKICKAFRAQGFEAYSCDILPSTGGCPEWHIRGDVTRVINGSGQNNKRHVGWLEDEEGTGLYIKKWDLAIFHPDCTYLTGSAEWAYKEGPYHQNVKPGTLVGKDRLEARAKAFEFFFGLWNCGIPHIAIENPVGAINSYMKPNQIINPFQFGDNASKKTCLWLRYLPKLIPAEYCEPRMVNGRPRWANQTDSGQNKIAPGPDRWQRRAETYQGIADAIADQWGHFLKETYK